MSPRGTAPVGAGPGRQSPCAASSSVIPCRSSAFRLASAKEQGIP